jgi:hypothetical protein
MLTTLEIPDEALEAARRASPAPLATAEDVVLGSVVQTGLSGSGTRRRIQTRLREASQAAETALRQDYSLRLPDLSPSSRDRLSSWVEANLKRQTLTIETVTRDAVADVLRSANYDGKAYELATMILSEQIRRGVTKHLRRYLASFAIQGTALRWTSSNLRDGYAVAQPERRGRAAWSVPVVRRKDDFRVGEVRLSQDGQILTSAAEIRDQIDHARAAA